MEFTQKQLEEATEWAKQSCKDLNLSGMGFIDISETDDTVDIRVLSKLRSWMRTFSQPKSDLSYYENSLLAIEGLKRAYNLPVTGELKPIDPTLKEKLVGEMQQGISSAEGIVYNGINRAISFFNIAEALFAALVLFLGVRLFADNPLSSGDFTESFGGRLLSFVFLYLIPFLFTLSGILKIGSCVCNFIAVNFKKPRLLRFSAYAHIVLGVVVSLPSLFNLLSSFADFSSIESFFTIIRTIVLNGAVIVMSMTYHTSISHCMSHAISYLSTGKLSYASMESKAGGYGIVSYVFFMINVVSWIVIFSMAKYGVYYSISEFLDEYSLISAIGVVAAIFYLVKHILVIIAVKKYMGVVQA